MINKILSAIAIVAMTSTGVIAAESTLDIPSEVTLFKNVKIFDGTTDGLKEGLDVLVVKNKIHKIAKDIPTTGTYEVDIKRDKVKEVSLGYGGVGEYSITLIDQEGKETTKQVEVNVIDGGGKTLMPGLIDQHVHVSTFLPLSDTRANMHPYAHGALALLRAKEMLMNGYTTVRDMGGPANYLKKIIDEGLTPGPRIYPSENWITTSSGHGDFRDLNDPNDGLSHFYSEYVQTVADGPDETTKAVRNAFRRGAVQIKLFTSGGVTSTYDPLHSGPNADEIQAAVKVAEAWDTYVATHSFNERAIKLAIDNGVKSIEHAPFLTDEIAKVMIERGIYLATGIAPVLEITVEQARSQYSTASFNKWLPVREAATELLKVLKRNPELKVVLGSDLLGPWNNMVATDDKMNLEFKYFAEAIGNYRALKMATSLAGEMNLMSGKMNPYPDSQLGIIEEGAYADLLLVDGNPLENIELMTAPDKNFKIIMKDGTIYKNSL
jgi:imidazolonepropionase-like amidohydrolase